MAGDWIKMRTSLDTDPRVIELAAMLEIAELHVIGCLWKLWAWADQHTIDGNAIRVTDVTLDRFTAVTGFAAALRKVGWLEGRDGALSFPRFAEHNGQTAKNRAETNKRVTKHRNAKSVTDVTQNALPEKRREEKSSPLSPRGGMLGEITIPETLRQSSRFMESLSRYAQLQGSHGRFNTIAFQDLVQKLSDYPEYRATAYLRYWTTENKFKPFWDSQWENYKPHDGEKPTRPEPKQYAPRVKLEGVGE